MSVDDIGATLEVSAKELQHTLAVIDMLTAPQRAGNPRALEALHAK
jgi:hypothetical protein